MNTCEKIPETPKAEKPTPIKEHPKSFGPSADSFLARFYASYEASSTDEKIKLLESKLGGPSNFYGLGGEVSADMKLACLESEYLELQGQITLTLA